MSDFDDRGRRIPDYDELQDAYEEKHRKRLDYGCLCGWPDMPGRCPGPRNCPMHGQELRDEEVKQ